MAAAAVKRRLTFAEEAEAETAGEVSTACWLQRMQSVVDDAVKKKSAAWGFDFTRGVPLKTTSSDDADGTSCSWEAMRLRMDGTDSVPKPYWLYPDERL